MNGVHVEPAAPVKERYADLIADEFSRVRVDVEQRGKPWTRSTVRRRTHLLDDGAAVSMLRWWGDDVQIVLLHGGGLHAHSWDLVATILETPLLALDLPGHGDSSWRDDADYSPETLARIVEAVIRAQATGPVVLVGQSLGALVALLVAHNAPELVSDLMMVDITPGRTGEAEASRQLVRFISGPQKFATYEDVISHALATGIGREAASLERGVVLNTRLDETGQLVFKHHLSSLPPQRHGDVSHLWLPVEHVQCSLQLVRGTRGIVDDTQVADFQRRRPDSAVYTLEAGHNVQRDAPEELAGLIRALIASR